MPSETIVQKAVREERCAPCKYLKEEDAGDAKIFVCVHEKTLAHTYGVDGQAIGNAGYPALRPDWCPIRGDAAAEEVAAQPDPMPESWLYTIEPGTGREAAVQALCTNYDHAEHEIRLVFANPALNPPNPTHCTDFWEGWHIGEVTWQHKDGEIVRRGIDKIVEDAKALHHHLMRFIR